MIRGFKNKKKNFIKPMIAFNETNNRFHISYNEVNLNKVGNKISKQD
jgi:hypothetical protein